MAKPKFSRPVQTVEEFYKLSKDIAHFAVKRSTCLFEYFHHYIVTGWLSTKQTIIEYYVCFSNCLKSISSGPGEVVENQISEDIIKRDIGGGKLYVIEAPNYPKTYGEIEEAKERFLERLGEMTYELASSNCEHLIAYILTGLPDSEQIDNAGPWKMIFVDSIDVFGSHAKRTIGKMFSCSLGVRPFSSFVKTVAAEALNVAAELAVNIASQTATTACRRVNELCKFACKTSQYYASQILKTKECSYIADIASNEALKKTACSTLLLTGFVEAAAATYEISKLEERKEKGILSERNCNREVTKTVCGAVSATVGTAVGGVIGQAMCPLPFLGYIAGSFLGNVSGRLIGSVLSGYCFDCFW